MARRIRSFFLGDEDCKALTALERGLGARGRRKLFEHRGTEGITSFDGGEVIVVSDHRAGSASMLRVKQEV